MHTGSVQNNDRIAERRDNIGNLTITNTNAMRTLLRNGGNAVKSLCFFGHATAAISLSILAAMLVSPARCQQTPDLAALPAKAATLLGVRCIKCHGPEKRSGGVDLSTRSLAISSNALISGNPDKSDIVTQTQLGKMPPDGSGRLSAAEVKLLRDWVAAGAVYSRDRLEAVKPPNKAPWSLSAIKHREIPRTKFDGIAKNPVDRFLFAKLQQSGLAPSPPAARRELIRRVTIDLTGLPPSLADIESFLADRSPTAYEKVVDRLIASPAYGERWGRHWLDVVRYGESNGYEQNHLRANSWPYRDYVIRSFNQDKPYDQFVTEQIAGDIVGKGDPEVEVATGFLVAGIHDTVGISTEEGTRQQRANDLDDIAATTGVTFLGLSVNCARCHDHKFDPIPTRDYYRLTAVFSGVYHGDRPLSPPRLSPEQQAQLRGIRSHIERVASAREAILQIGKQTLLGRSGGRREPVNGYHNEERFAPVLARFVRFTVTATNNGAEPCLDELEVYGPKSDTGNLALASTGALATASSLLPGYAIHQIKHLNDGLHGNSHSWISNEPAAGWAQIELPKAVQVSRVVWARDSEKLLTDRVPTGYRIEVSVDAHTWRLAASSADRSVDSSQFTEENIRMALNADQRVSVDSLTAEMAALQRKVEALAPVSAAYCGRFQKPEPAYILPRGDVMHRGEQVTPGALSQIPGLSGELSASVGPGPLRAVQLASDRGQSSASVGTAMDESGNPRVMLARWICDSRNPLTPRVIVNRVWERHFGRGIVDTPSDFGNMGSLPSHPELLDWLANDFVQHGWRLKRLHKMLVTSYSYCQSSAVTPDGQAKDGDNRLVWHMPLRRMEAEAVRDSILSVSGKLNLAAAGGPGFQLFKYTVVNVAIFETREDQGQDTWRRSVYQIPARGIRDDLLGAFDCPDSSERAAHRTSTTTALQALSMLNGSFINQQSRFFAQRVTVLAQGNLDKQVRTAFQLAFGRSPQAQEAAAAAALAHRDGLSTLCRGLFNANEFLYY